MGTPTKLTVERIIEISSAIDLIGESNALTSTTAYRLARLKKWAESIAKLYYKERERAVNEFRDELNDSKTEPERKQKINEIINDKLTELLELEEEIKIPEFKLSDFTAKDKTKVSEKDKDGKTTEREVQAGQMLLSQKFFNMMGDIIQDESSLDDFKFGDSSLGNKLKELGDKKSKSTSMEPLKPEPAKV